MSFFEKIMNVLVDAPAAFAVYGTEFIQSITNALSSVLYMHIGPLPLATVWILVGFVFFTVRLRGIPFTLLPHTIDIIRGKYNNSSDIGIFTHKEAICTAALGTVGLGAIAGVAVAVVKGGPGAIFWMAVVGILGVSVKFAEVTLAHKYRKIDKETGEVSGGPLLYIKAACGGRFAFLGRLMALMYALALLGIGITSANMFQSNQTMVALKDSFPFIADHYQLVAVGIVAMIAVVAMGGAGLVGKIGTAIVPFMSLLYIVLAAVVLIVDYKAVPGAFAKIFTYAFETNSAKWGIVGAIVAGATRSIYTTESGGGTSGMAHAPAKTSEPVREGLTAAIEAFIPLAVSLVTGLVIIVTGVYESAGAFGGVLLTKAAFNTVSAWFPQALSISIFFIAMTTVMAWSYYGRLAWAGVFGNRGVYLFIAIFLSATYYGMVSDSQHSQDLILSLSDCLWLGATFPNLFALYVLSNELYRDTISYRDRYRANNFGISA